MRYESVLELKQSLTVEPTRVASPVLGALRVRSLVARRAIDEPRLAARLETTHTRPVGTRKFSMGIARGRGRNDYRLGVRIHETGGDAQRLKQEISRRAEGEVDIEIVPHVRRRAARATMWFRRMQRPLERGLSIGVSLDSAGTLGAFVEDDDGVYVLSNNHVLAEVNSEQPGAPISQPGDLDRKMKPETLIGVLDRFVPISFSRSNVTDCAVAHLFKDVRIKNPGMKKLEPLTRDDLGRPVIKAGRTTGVTRGEITLVDLDGLAVDMADEGQPRKEATFSDCVEIKGRGRSFSAAGDSGSLILDLEGRPRALLFCGTEDPKGPDLTYGNRIETCLKKLGVKLVTR